MSQLDLFGSDLIRNNRKKKFVWFDFETEGLNHILCRPWELSYIVTSLDRDEPHFTSENFLYYNDLFMPQIIRELCHFDDELYAKKSQDPRKVMLEFNNICEQVDFVCGHNIIGFDMGIYYNTCIRHGVKPLNLSNKIIDTLPITKSLPGKLNIPKKPDEKLLDWQLRVNSVRTKTRGFATLQALCKEVGVTYEQEKAHRAIYDVAINWQAFKKILNKLEI